MVTSDHYHRPPLALVNKITKTNLNSNKMFFYVKVTTLLKSSWGLINKELACKWVYRLL